ALLLEYQVCRGFRRLHAERPILPGYVAELNERTLLTADQEADLFLRMNYCKFRADIFRRQLPPDGADIELAAAAQIMSEIDGYLAAATQLRDSLVRAFLKLAISLLGPFVSRRHG